MDCFDIAIIGGGPGGYVCAIRASQLGLKVAVIEKEDLGGTCLNKGCIPTKSILQSSKVLHNLKNSLDFGIESKISSINIDSIINRSKNIINTLNRGVSGLLSKNKITVIKGIASFIDKNTLKIEENDKISEIKAKNIVISTGAKPKLIPNLDENLIKNGLIWTSKEAISPSFIPKDLLIIGSGAIGIELASFYNSIGSRVTVIEIQDRILIQEDKEISDAAFRSFKKQGINILLNTKSQNFKEKDGKILVDLINKNNEIEESTFDIVILAIGVVPNIDSLNLDKIGIKTKENKIIETFDYQETNIKGIYAIGDVTNAPWLAHKASREGIICAEKIAGLSEITPINLKNIPSCTYSYPQIASIGLTEEKAKEQNIPIKIGKSYFKGNGKALAVGDSDGFVKVIFHEKTGELLGAHMIGYEVTELIPIFSVAISGELTEKELMSAVFPHPTMSECIQEAIYSAFGISIHG